MKRRTVWVLAGVAVLGLFLVGAAQQVSREEFGTLAQRVDTLEARTTLLSLRLQDLDETVAALMKPEAVAVRLTGTEGMEALPVSANLWSSYEYINLRSWKPVPGEIAVQDTRDGLKFERRLESANQATCAHPTELTGDFVVAAQLLYVPAGAPRCTVGLLNLNTASAMYIGLPPNRSLTVELRRKNGKLTASIQGEDMPLAADYAGKDDIAGRFAIGLCPGDRLLIRAMGIWQTPAASK
jgi:hypothetical protein